MSVLFKYDLARENKLNQSFTMAIALFQPKTATGKLNAVIMPISPKGFHFSMSTWPGRSDGKIVPGNVRDNPRAKSQTWMYSTTSPIASGKIFPEK